MKKIARILCLLSVFSLFSCVEVDDSDNADFYQEDDAGAARQDFNLRTEGPGFQPSRLKPPDVPPSEFSVPSFCYEFNPSVFSKFNPSDLRPVPEFPMPEVSSLATASISSLSSPLALAPDQKLTYSVRHRLFGPWNKKPTGEIGLAIWFHTDVALSEGEAIVKKYGGTFEGKVKLLNVILIAIPEEKLDDFYKIKHESAVRVVDIWPAKLEAENDRVRRTAGVDKMRITYPEYDGTGVIVGVYDAGIVCPHPDFGRRLIVADEGEYCAEHATHVAGTLGGSGACSEEWGRLNGEDILPFQFMGVAPGVQIVSYGLGGCGDTWGGCLYNDPGDIEEDFGEMISVYDVGSAGMSLGVNVARNFEPCAWEGDTCLTSILLDTFVYLRRLIVTLSASNERSPYYYHRCGDKYGTMSPPAPAKNAIVVGASNEYGAPTDFTGFGPTDDGRIGITGCILGEDVWSTVEEWDGYGYDEMSGTSMSRPAMNGVVALMTQVFYEKYDARPSPSLAKAIIVNSLEESPLTPYGPDFMCGFGVMSEFSTLEVVETVLHERFIEDVIKDGESKQYVLVTFSETPEIRVTLAWTDRPGSIERQELGLPQLVNDLDLTVNGVKPLVPDSTHPDYPARETEDHLNNVEQVVIVNPVINPKGACFIIKVKGYNVPEGPQKFSLAYSGARAWPFDIHINKEAIFGSVRKSMPKEKFSVLPKNNGG